MNNYWDKYPVLKKELEAIEDILRENMKCKDKGIEESLLKMISAGGKMLRPSFLLLAGRFGKFNSKKLYPLASVIELLHMATLIHDDIIDNSEYRRGVRTIQSEFGPNYAVFTGDLLFTRCFMLLSDNTSMSNMKLISNVIAKICQGEIEQYSAHFQIENTVKQYLKRISTKTAVLFSLSLLIGASESKCSKKLTKDLGRIGYNIGMAFQIIDDILDYVGSEDIVGKPLGNDLKHGIFTLPLIYTLKLENNGVSEILKKKDYSEEDIKYIISKTVELGGLEKARELAHRYTDRAFKILNTLPNGESKRILTEITETLLIREY
jgi:heptaprenyl diphosphate synthase